MLEAKNSQKTDLEKLGEFGLIDHLTKDLPQSQSSTVLSIGDDAAVLDHQGYQTVVTTDMLVEGVHFDLAYMPLRHLGYKAVVVNVSDICAMNAKATQITVSVAVSNRFPLEALEDLFDGITVASQEYNNNYLSRAELLADSCIFPFLFRVIVRPYKQLQDHL